MALFSLRNQKEFNLVNKLGVKKHSCGLILVLAPNFSRIVTHSPNPTFLGMKVSRKFSKKAVIRNKVKRRIRHLVRNILRDESVKTCNTAFIIIPKKGFDQLSFKKINKDFRNTFIKILASFDAPSS